MITEARERLVEQVDETVPAVSWLGRWCSRHTLWVTVWSIAFLGALFVGEPLLVVAIVVVGASIPVVCCVWAFRSPLSYERLVGGPLRRSAWRQRIRKRWIGLARSAGWTTRAVVSRKRDGRGGLHEVHSEVAPSLRRVVAKGNVVTIHVRARSGQTLEELEAGVPKLVATLDAISSRAYPAGASMSVLVVELVMADLLSGPTNGRLSETRDGGWSAVRAGRLQSGEDWMLPLLGRHLLVAGRTGAGKGSVLWDICCGIAPYVPADVVRLWGIDLKGGVELKMGRELFSTIADNTDDAVRVLRKVKAVVDERSKRMAGVSRTHEARPGDPMHLLVIDELATLIAYNTDREARVEAERLLAEILSKGRGAGVAVAAFVQDPRKENVSMRELFSDRIALRLATASEAEMVLGVDPKLAPAHRVSRHTPGVGWIVDETGAVDRARADYWSDKAIRHIAAAYPTRVHIDLADDPDAAPPEPPARPERKRAPRKPRQPRPPRSQESKERGQDAGLDGVA